MNKVKKDKSTLIEVDSISINEFSEEYRRYLDNSGLLKTEGYRTKAKSEAIFDDDVWIFYRDIYQNYIVLEFNDFNDIVSQKYITREDIILLKCWVVNKIMDEYEPIGIQRSLSYVKNIIINTNNFELNKFNSCKGNLIHTLMQDISDSTRFVSNIRDYICFLDEIDLVNEGHQYALYLLDDINTTSNLEVRKIPSSKDINAFEYYLKKFYKECEYSDFKEYYMPILLWWKLTMVIPMRPSEFIYKIKRNCLEIIDGEYYIKIGRVKVNDKSKKKGRIPILKKLKITKEIFDLIEDYIELTSFDTTSKTLISYEALLYFRKKIISNENKGIQIRHQSSMKGCRDYANIKILKSLLESFYKIIINGFYKDVSMKQLKLGDTRHLAFTSLLLQGISPIEIAMLGGHTTLKAQESYTGHVDYYIDSEILDFVSNRNLQSGITDKSLIKIIFNKPTVCPRFLCDCHKTEDGVGYCTLDIKNVTELCDNVEYCILCKKWWCEPTNENYLRVKEFLENNVIAPLKRFIEEENNFLLKLLSEAKTINVDGLLDLDKNYEEYLSQARLKLKSNIDKMIMLKKYMLESQEKEDLKIRNEE